MNNNKGFSNLVIIGLVIAITIVGLIGYFILFPKPTTPPQEKPAPQIAIEPYVDVEATVSSLLLDALYSYCKAPEVCPRDRVTLKLDKVDRTGDPNNAMNLNVGDEIEFHLKYSARPAKLRRDIPPTCPTGWILKAGSCVEKDCEGSECTALSPQYDVKPAELENDYLVYHLPQYTDKVTEKILPGLKEGSKIKIRIWQSDLLFKEIDEYEIIP